MSKKKVKETDEDKCLRILIGDGKPFQEGTKDNVLSCLEKIGGEKTFNAIREALNKKLFLDWHDRNRAIILLSSLGGEQVVDMLLNLLKEEKHDYNRETIIGELGKIQDYLIEQGKEMSATQQQKVVLRFCRLLSGGNKETDWYIRCAIAWALRFFKCEMSIVALETALSDEMEEVREDAKKSLFYLEHGCDEYDLFHNKIKKRQSDK